MWLEKENWFGLSASLSNVSIIGTLTHIYKLNTAFIEPVLLTININFKN